MLTMKRNKLPDIQPIITEQNFREMGYDLNHQEATSERIYQMHVEHREAIEEVLFNVIAYGIAMTTLKITTQLDSDVDNPFKYKFVTRISQVNQEDIFV